MTSKTFRIIVYLVNLPMHYRFDGNQPCAKKHVDPVVARLVGLGGEAAGRPAG